MKARCYLVIAPGRGDKAAVRRVTARRPALDGEEAVIELELDLPDDVFDAPLFTVPVEKRQVLVGIEPADVEP